MPSVFLSYARNDAAEVDRIATDLRAEGIQVWLDRDMLVAGEPWVDQIETAINTADFLVFFISSSSLKSKWALEEYRAAFTGMRNSGGSRIIPVLLEEVPELPPFIAQYQYADFTKSYYSGMQSLLRALTAARGPKPTEVIDAGKLAKQVAGEVAKLLGLERASDTQHDKAPESNLVFVVTAFAPDMDPVFDGISDAAKAVGLMAKRVKDIQGDYRITDQIVSMIQAARLVVVDLSHERPNVYFELGYARGLGKTVVTIAREGTNVHFDVKDWVYISYVDSRILEKDLKKRFEFELSRVPSSVV